MFKKGAYLKRFLFSFFKSDTEVELVMGARNEEG